MNDDDKLKLIHNYLAAADKINKQIEMEEKNSVQHQQMLEKDQKIFEQVIAELGLSSEQQNELAEMAVDFLNQAQDHFFKKSYSNCIELAEKSHQLLPFDLRPMELLLRIYTLDGETNQPEKALQYATAILEIEPKHIDAKKITIGTENNNLRKALVMIGGLCLGFIVINIFVKSSPEVSETAQVEEPEAKKITAELLEKPEIIYENVPVDGIIFEDRGSKFSHYNESFSYALNVYMLNSSNEEIKSINGFVELLDASGEVIIKSKQKFREDYHPSLRKGQSDSLNATVYQSYIPDNYSHPQKIRIRFETFEHFPSPPSISKEDVELHWPKGKNEEYDVTVQRRKFEPTFSDFMGEWSMQSSYEITNNGKGIIKKLKLKEEILSDDGEVIHESEQFVTYSSTAYISPNETRLEFFIAMIHKKPASLRLSVVEIE
jgi:hypothetical protein